MKQFPFRNLKKDDPTLWRLVDAEVKRQEETIDLIPSENSAPLRILELLGSPLTNKYSEGYPGRRYYPGNHFVDAIETLARARALKAFRLSPQHWSANVQPYSGSPANTAVYFGLMDVGDTLLGMALSAGGHLTHGHRVTISGKVWHAVQYGVDATSGRIDYDEVSELARRHRPKVIVSGATAYPRLIDFKKFGAIAGSIGAYHLADISHIAGLVAAGLHPSPFPHADVVMTTTHKILRGPRGAVIFSKSAIAERIDRAVFPGLQGGPHNNVTAAIANTFYEVGKPSFKHAQKQIVANAKILAKVLIEHGAKLISGGTDNHLVLLDARPFGLDGKAAETLLEEAGIIVNRNSIPGDSSPFKPSGVRMGTPSLTSRGMKEQEMGEIGGIIVSVLTKSVAPSVAHRRILNLCRRFPVYDHS